MSTKIKGTSAFGVQSGEAVASARCAPDRARPAVFATRLDEIRARLERERPGHEDNEIAAFIENENSPLR